MQSKFIWLTRTGCFSGLKGSEVQRSVIIGIIVVRYILLPIFGVVIVKSAVRLGLVQSNPLYQFVLLLQYALPPAMNIGTIFQAILRIIYLQNWAFKTNLNMDSEFCRYNDAVVWNWREWMLSDSAMDLCIGLNFTNALVNIVYVACGVEYWQSGAALLYPYLQVVWCQLQLLVRHKKFPCVPSSRI